MYNRLYKYLLDLNILYKDSLPDRKDTQPTMKF